MNLSKPKIVPIGDVGDVEELTNILGCGVASLPIKYLGLSLGAKYKDSNIWTSIIEKMEEIGGVEEIVFIKGWEVNIYQYYML
jgi:hypothetical protein